MFYIIIILWIFLDLGSKYIAQLYLQDKINIAGDFLYLEYFENSGIAFSIQLPLLLLKILTITLIIWIFYYYKQEKKNIWENNSVLFDISFALILAWAIWNGIERIINEKVIDFIGVQYFAVFNIADSCISIGAFLYIYLLYKK